MSIASEITRLQNAKVGLKTAIEDSGVTVPEGTKLDGYPALTGSIIGQFSDDLDTIIGGDTTPVTDITARLATVNGVSGDVDTQLDTLDSTKASIKSAIVAKGVEVPDTTTFAEYAGKIAGIQSGATIETSQVTIVGAYVSAPGSTNKSTRFIYIDESLSYSDESTSETIVRTVANGLIVVINAGPTSTAQTYSGQVEKLSDLMYDYPSGFAYYGSVYRVYGDCSITNNK